VQYNYCSPPKKHSTEYLSKTSIIGAPEWLSWLSIRHFDFSSVMISGLWDQALLQALAGGRDCLGFSLPLPLPLTPTHLHSLSRKNKITGAWVAQLVKRLPSAQVMVPGSWDGAPHWAPCLAGGLLLPLPLPLLVFLLSFCQINK